MSTGIGKPRQSRAGRSSGLSAARDLDKMTRAARSGKDLVCNKVVNDDITAIHHEMMSQLETAEVVSFVTYLMDPDTLYNHCRAVPIGYQADGGSSAKMRLESSAFGSLGGEVCDTCHLTNLCPGHLGHIRLYYGPGSVSPTYTEIIDLSVYNPMVIKDVAMLLRFVCPNPNCHSFVANIEAFKEIAHRMGTEFNTRLKELYVEVADKIKICPVCNEILPTYKVDAKFNAIHYDKIDADGKSVKTYMMPPQAYEMLNIIDKRSTPEGVPYRKLLGFNTFNEHTRSSPLGCIHRITPVTPRHIRIDFENSEGKVTKNPLNTQYENIINSVQKYIDIILGKIPVVNVDDELTKLYSNINRAVVSLYKPISKVAQQARHSYTGLQDGGKNGFTRKHLMAKRAKRTARAVLGPAPVGKLRLEEAGIPMYLRNKLTPDETVTNTNIKKMRQLLKDKHIVRVERKGMYFDMWISNVYYPPPAGFDIQPGDIVTRFLENGDIVLMNRNPTVHKWNISAHNAKLTNTNNTQMRLFTYGAKGADNDGDEMNMLAISPGPVAEEAKKLLHVDNCHISGAVNAPVEGVIIDARSFSYKMTSEDSYISWTKFQYILQTYAAFEEMYRTLDQLLLDGSQYNKDSVSLAEGGDLGVPVTDFDSPTLSIRDGVLSSRSNIVNVSDYINFVKHVGKASIVVPVNAVRKLLERSYVDYTALGLVIQEGEIKTTEIDLMALTNLVLYNRDKAIELNDELYMENYLQAYSELTNKLADGELTTREAFNQATFLPVELDVIKKQIPTWYKETPISTDIKALNDLARDIKNKINPIYKRFEIQVHGRTLYSVLFPTDFNYEQGGVIINNGILRSGPLTANEISTAPYSIAYVLKNHGRISDANNRYMRNFISGLETLAALYADLEGMSLSVASCLYGDQRIQQINRDVISDMKRRVALIGKPKTAADKVKYDRLVTAEVNIVPKVAERIIQLLPADHPMVIMAKSKAKGNTDIISQALGALGPSLFEGKLQEPSLTGNTRCHPAFVPGSNDLEAYGFCESSLINGVPPNQYMFLARVARRDLQKISLETGNIGAAARKLQVGSAEIVSYPDGTIRDLDGSILQFIYLDGYNPANLMKVKLANGEEILSFTNVNYHAVNITTFGSNKFLIKAPAFNLNAVSKIINYFGIVTEMSGKVTVRNITTFAKQKGIRLSQEQVDELNELELGVNRNKLKTQLDQLTVSSGRELIDGEKVTVEYPYFRMNGRNAELYVDPRDVKRINEIFVGVKINPV